MLAERTLVPARLVFVPVAFAAVAELVAWVAFAWPGTLEAGWYGRPTLLLAVHTITLGTLAASILGIGWQVVTVITAHAWRPGLLRLLPWINRVFVVGVPLLLAGMFAPAAPWALCGAGLVVGALAVRSGLVIIALVDPGRQARRRVAVRVWVGLAEGAMLAGLVVAVGLWAGRAGHPVFGDPVRLVGLHAAWLLGGWVGGWIVGAGSLLLPMFAVSREPPSAWMLAAAAAWFGGLAVGSPWVFALGAAAAGVALIGPLVRGLKRTPGLVQAGLGLVALVGIGLVGAGVPPDALVAFALTGVALPVLHGVGQRIVPFLVWNHAGRGRAPADLVSDRAAVAQLVAGALGAVLLVVSRVAEVPVGAAGAALLFLSALLHLRILGAVWARTRRVEADWLGRSPHVPS